MSSPLVSIIIPVFNSEKYLEETIFSAINQTWSNKEIIIVDDGSTDNSLAIAKRYENSEVKVLSQPNQGASIARNLGLKEAKGEYIQFLDADDLISPNKIEAQMQILIPDIDYVGLCATMHFNDGTDHILRGVDHDWIAAGSNDTVDFLIKLYGGDIMPAGMVQPNAWLTPKALIDKAGPWNEMRSPDDDGEFFCRVLLAAKGVRYADDAVNYYRKFNSADTWSAQKSYEAQNNILQSTLLKVKHLTAKTDDPRAKLALNNLLWDNAFNFYPYFRDLSLIAENKAKELLPGIKYNPYKTRINFILAKAFGWKTVKYLQYLKQQLLA